MPARVLKGRLTPWTLAVVAVLAVVALPGAAQARPVTAVNDGRPNILVVMTDDQALADVAKMPNVRRLLTAQGTTFADAIDSFPLCCPARATFITGQYAHNHGVGGNFYPFGWYGMTDRGNILPAWLQKVGYRTALIGKWLNGYGALDAHGEVPDGFDIWRGLLDVSAYDYYNYVMNQNGLLKAWGDPDFARKLVEFAIVEVTPIDPNNALATVFAKLRELFGPPPYTYFGAQNPQDYSPDVTGKITEDLVRAEKNSTKPFFIWWAPAAPHREDVATTLLGREGPDPRPAPRYADKVSGYTLPRPPSFNEADFADKPSNMRDHAPSLTETQVQQLQLDYQGRIGSLLAVDDHVAQLVRVLRATNQLSNTLIVFVSDNGWLQGEHHIPGDKFLPYEESIRVPFILRGPGVPAGRTVRGQVSNIDFAPTLVDAAKAKAGRTMDGGSLMPTIRHPKGDDDDDADDGEGGGKPPLKRAYELEALAPLFQGNIPINGWDRPYKGVRTDRYTYVVYTETGERELYDLRKDPYQLRNVVNDSTYAKIEKTLARKLAKLDRCKGRSCKVAP
jgi:N-acetylglucosamine-6-sulfatase